MQKPPRKNSKPDPVRRLAALVHAVVRQAPAACYADLKADVTAEAARLRLPYDAGTVTAAIALVERTRPVLHVSRSGVSWWGTRSDAPAGTVPPERAA